MFKGQEIIDLGLLVIVCAILLGAFLLLLEFNILNIKIGISSKVNALIITDYNGSALVSLLKANKGGINYAETIGSLNASLNPTNPKSDFDKDLVTILKNLNIEMTVRSDDNTPIKEYDKLDNDNIKAEIALPGGRKGKVQIS